ncbi:unnamed protein product [Peronospora belbahrii]|uniref:Temptin Cys/Cys disulfide domain-containing protein n=1 Tax=Peronospora belbahrii TaxID=622444 RepID=A0AAU9L772_9STRA|nr:unnamed protein product [Peronospora belbahrii]
MLAFVQIAVAVATFMQAASAYSSYMKLIPNGLNLGKPLGHSETSYTDFGTLFSDKGTEWLKVCSLTWPGGSVTCGEALGDPCCKWSSNEPDYTLTEVNTDGTKCADDSASAAPAPSEAPTGDIYKPTGHTAAKDLANATAAIDSTYSAAFTDLTDNAVVTDPVEDLVVLHPLDGTNGAYPTDDTTATHPTNDTTATYETGRRCRH